MLMVSPFYASHKHNITTTFSHKTTSFHFIFTVHVWNFFVKIAIIHWHKVHIQQRITNLIHNKY